MEIIFIGFAVILGLYLLLNLAGILLGIFTEYVLPILVYCGIGSFFFWLVFWIFGIKEFFGISTIIIGAILGFIVWILVTFFNNNGGFGEIGLDLYWDKTFLKEQILVFEKQIEWALEYGLPIVIHSREAFEYIYKVMEPYKNTPLTGIFHSFTGTSEEAAKLLEFEGFMLGINGVVTFKKSTLPEALTTVPLERIVLETDSPYLAPVPNRGKRNESANVRDTLMKVADIYQMDPEYVAQVTSVNALKVFGIRK